jgi:hypothetical protein
MEKFFAAPNRRIRPDSRKNHVGIHLFWTGDDHVVQVVVLCIRTTEFKCTFVHVDCIDDAIGEAGRE